MPSYCNLPNLAQALSSIVPVQLPLVWSLSLAESLAVFGTQPKGAVAHLVIWITMMALAHVWLPTDLQVS